MKKVIFLLVTLLFTTCSSKKAETVVIVGNEGSTIHGNVTMELGASGKFEPKIWVEGYIVVFRVDSDFGKSFGNAGNIYRINDKLLLDEIEKFDLKLSDEEILKEYLSE